jgi:hypothetical protein
MAILVEIGGDGGPRLFPDGNLIDGHQRSICLAQDRSDRGR